MGTADMSAQTIPVLPSWSAITARPRRVIDDRSNCGAGSGDPSLDPGSRREVVYVDGSAAKSSLVTPVRTAGSSSRVESRSNRRIHPPT